MMRGLYGYVGLLVAFGVVFVEFLLRAFLCLLPVGSLQKIMMVFFSPTRHSPRSHLSQNYGAKEDKLGRAYTTNEMIHNAGYQVEEHVVHSSDGYLLLVHRIPPKFKEKSKGPVLMMHGFLMSSEVWAVKTNNVRGLAYVLSDAGYDVWLGNNRGNKYSNKHVEYKPAEQRFWDFSLDELAQGDIPAFVNYILETTQFSTLSYVGFSQGTAQAFAAFSIQPELAKKINVFVALAPCTKVKEFAVGLGDFLVDPMRFASPLILFLLFGKRAFLPTTLIWQHALPSAWFAVVIDGFNRLLFGWKGVNIGSADKSFLYHHLYSCSSVKVVTHWSQILRAQRFQMFDESAWFPSHDYIPMAFPIDQILCPIAMFYGGSDTLPDCEYTLNKLTHHKQCQATEIPHYEHLDFLWARDAEQLVFQPVVSVLDKISEEQQLLELGGVPTIMTQRSSTVSPCSVNSATSTHTVDRHSTNSTTSSSGRHPNSTNSWEELSEDLRRNDDQLL